MLDTGPQMTLIWHIENEISPAKQSSTTVQAIFYRATLFRCVSWIENTKKVQKMQKIGKNAHSGPGATPRHRF